MAELSIVGGYGYLDEARTKKLLSEVYSEIGLRNLVPPLKERHPFLRCVFSSPLKNVALRMAKAIASHRKSKNGQRCGPDVGWVKYKAWAKYWMSLEYDEPGKGWNVSQFGWLNLSFGANAQGQRLSLRLKMETQGDRERSHLPDRPRGPRPLFRCVHVQGAEEGQATRHARGLHRSEPEELWLRSGY
ncbi:hypothetical protein [Cupriavidus necator]|uniref:hypothetical protein n=1 Tax=Cupriavidus necator TaxID=106590 RepID=UPI0012D2E81E|nr:hypothetical protein [Cupriavidus necator]